MTRQLLPAILFFAAFALAPTPVVATPGALVDDLARAGARLVPRAAHSSADDLARIGLRETAERVAARHGDEAVDAMATWASRHGDDLTHAMGHPIGDDAVFGLLRALPEGQIDDAIHLLARSHGDDALTRTLRMHGDEGLRFALAHPHRGARVLGAVDVTTGRQIMRVWTPEQTRVASAMLQSVRAGGPEAARVQRLLDNHGARFVDFVREHRLWIGAGAGSVVGLLALHEVSEIADDFERTVGHGARMVTEPAIVRPGSLAHRVLTRVHYTVLVVLALVVVAGLWFVRPWIAFALRRRARADQRMNARHRTAARRDVADSDAFERPPEAPVAPHPPSRI